MSRFVSLVIVLAVCATAFAQVPRSHHVVVLTLENHSYEQVIGNPNMPYYNQLAAKYGLAAQYYSSEHDSITGLMYLVAGTWITHDDYTTKVFDADNIVREMNNSGGRTWRVYASQLPSIGFTGYTTSGTYLRRHNPLSYFTDIYNNPAEAQNMVPLDPYFQQDVANGTLPEYSYVVPDSYEDAHDGTLAEADQWMAANIPQLLASPQFQKDGILLVVWDEGDLDPIGNFKYNDSRGEALDPNELLPNPDDPDTIWATPGGRTATLVIGPGVKPGYVSQTFYNSQSLLRTTCDALGLNVCPGKAATALPMKDFFAGQSDTVLRQPREVVISSPTQTSFSSSSGTAVSVQLVANAVDRVCRRVTGMIAYLDGQKVAGGDGVEHIDTSLSLSPGTHILHVTAWSWDTSMVSGVADKLVTYYSERTLTVGMGTAPTTIAGHVTDISSGKGIAGATVAIAGQTTSSDSNGAFSINSVNPGTYMLTASAGGYFQESTAVDAISGTTTIANVQLPTGGKVLGKVIADGSPLANATITVVGGSVATTKTVTTDSTGSFNSSWIPVGSYSVSVNANGFSVQTATTTVNTGVSSTINFTLNSHATVSGKITDISTGKPIAGAIVKIGTLQTTADIYGSYTLSLNAGSVAGSASANGYFSSSRSLNLVSGENTANFQLPTGGKVGGTVKNSSGTPVSNATVTISGGVVYRSVTTTTNSVGAFNSSWVPVGSYTIKANSGASAATASANVTTGNTTTLNVQLP